MKLLSISSLKSSIKQLLYQFKHKHNAHIGKGVTFSADTRIKSGSLIGRNSCLSSGVVIEERVKIGSDTILELIEIGSDSRIDSRVICTGSKGGRITMGQNSYIGINNVLDHSDNVSIGSYVHIAGPSTGLWTHTSASMCLNSVKISEQSVQNRPTAPITIEDNVYIGGNCTIYPGITIGHHAVVAPNSAVTKSVPPYSMVGGVPAKFIKHTYDMIESKDGQ